MNTLTTSKLSRVAAAGAPEIIDSLKSQAQTAIGSALGTQPLVAFETGALGNFPYYYTDPSNLMFNSLTYNWINNSLNGDEPPIQQMPGSLFTNSVLDVLATVTYSLSKADQVKLNNAYSAAQNQQMALLTAWKAAYGSLPTPAKNQTIVDAIMSIVCTTWASPATTPYAMQNSTNLGVLLNAAPNSGRALFPLLGNYLNALGDSMTLFNAQVMRNAYVAQALAALQTPTAANGAMQLNDGSSKFYPAYTVNTPLSDILNGLQNPAEPVQLEMEVNIASETEYSVSVSGKAGFTIPFLDFFTLGIKGSASYFHDEIVKQSSSVTVKMSFSGVTVVNFVPNVFNESTGQNWFSLQPILDAIKNDGQDVSGYHFSPEPGTEFGPTGSFGILQGLAISNYPSIEIVITSDNYKSIQTTFQQQVSTSLTFLGIPLASASESTYSNSASSSESNSTVTITLDPPPNMVAGTSVSSLGWILGVQTFYPTVPASA
jgi:hypothetical protein